MSQCTKKIGAYRCARDLKPDNSAHDGECEPETQTRKFACPFSDDYRARAYWRGIIDALQGPELAAFGISVNVQRNGAEPDAAYRERIWMSR